MNRRDKENCLAALYETLAHFSDKTKIEELGLNEEEIARVKFDMAEVMVLISKLESDLAE
jgi:hypothetical protein